MAVTPVQEDSSSTSGIGELIAVIVCMTTLSAVAAALRLWTRLVIQHMRLAADDWIIIFAWALCLAYGTCNCVATRYGFHQDFASYIYPLTENTITVYNLDYCAEVCYVVAVALTRVSILSFYMRLFPQKVPRVMIWVMMIFVVLAGVAFTLATIFQCMPVHKFWLPDTPGTCVDSLALFRANSWLGIFQDFAIYLFPSPILWNISLPARQRIILIGIFVVGGCVCIVGILRLCTFKIMDSSIGTAWDLFSPTLWSNIESNLGIVCACLVHIKPLIAKFAPSLLDLPSLPKKRKMMQLSDQPSESPLKSDLLTFGQRQGARPVGILTELELEDNLPHMGITAMAVSNIEVTTSEADIEQSNAIYKTTDFIISYNRK